MTLKDAFAHFGAVARNPRWSWSARSPDGRTVVLAIWEAELRSGFVDTFGWQSNRPGYRERVADLIHARDHCGGLFRVVEVHDTREQPYKVADAQPLRGRTMQLTDFNEKTGEFRARFVA
jgi:hypothetical protein